MWAALGRDETVPSNPPVTQPVWSPSTVPDVPCPSDGMFRCMPSQYPSKWMSRAAFGAADAGIWPTATIIAQASPSPRPILPVFISVPSSQGLWRTVLIRQLGATPAPGPDISTDRDAVKPLADLMVRRTLISPIALDPVDRQRAEISSSVPFLHPGVARYCGSRPGAADPLPWGGPATSPGVPMLNDVKRAP